LLTEADLTQKYTLSQHQYTHKKRNTERAMCTERAYRPLCSAMTLCWWEVALQRASH